MAFDFDKCSKHKYEPCPENLCQECEKQQILVKKFQTHKHTFTCKKKKKMITVRENEGHGRLDGKIEGQKITNHVGCRFNFPQFPLNRTKVYTWYSQKPRYRGSPSKKRRSQ